MPLFESKPADPLWKLPRVAEFFGVSGQTIKRAVARGEFPSPLAITRGVKPRLAWYRSTLDAHKAKLLAEAAERTRRASAQP